MELSRNKSGSTERKEHGSLLLVEFDPLLRWSTATYLNRWYEVHAVDTLEAGHQLLSEHYFDAIVVSSDSRGTAIHKLEEVARLHNEHVRIIHLVTGVEERSNDPGVQYVEKPFEFESLSQALRVQDDKETNR